MMIPRESCQSAEAAQSVKIGCSANIGFNNELLRNISYTQIKHQLLFRPWQNPATSSNLLVLLPFASFPVLVFALLIKN
jgi:hypothetical protein